VLTREAGWAVVLPGLGFNIVLGVLPVGFITATSLLVGRAALSVSFASLAIPAGVAALIFMAQMLLGALQRPYGDLVARRVDGKVFQRFMIASLAPAGLEFIDDHAVLDDVAEARRELEYGFYSPGQACAGLLALVPRYLQLASFVAVVALCFSGWAAAGLLATIMLFRHGQRGGLREFCALIPVLTGKRREAFYLREVATGAPAGKEIRVFGLADWLTGRYRAASIAWMRPVWAERRRIYLKPFLAYLLVGLLVIGMLLAFLGARAARGELRLEDLALVLQAVIAAIQLGDHYPEADSQTELGMQGYEALRRVERAAERYQAGEQRHVRHVARVTRPSREIRFEHVAFRYPGQVGPVLDGLDLTIPVGKSTALVGLNGAGKTTIIKLLCGLYTPEQGAILLDGTDIRAFQRHEWHRQIGVIFQDFVQYEASMADNIGFGAVERVDDRQAIMAAAAAAGADDVVAGLPAGLDTPLAAHLTGGAELSRGQWQRVALARALFALSQGASILVLDEPTASLDVRAEAQFYEEFMSSTRGVTTVLISHRFASVRHADHIAVLRDGRVVEQGSHAELLELGGNYAMLFRLQAAPFASDAPMAVNLAEDDVST
jgi:ATP-binding cassette, subfamily B, bacterial